MEKFDASHQWRLQNRGLGNAHILHAHDFMYKSLAAVINNTALLYKLISASVLSHWPYKQVIFTSALSLAQTTSSGGLLCCSFPSSDAEIRWH